MTLYLDTPENTSVLELKKMIEGIMCVSREIFSGVITEFFLDILFES